MTSAKFSGFTTSFPPCPNFALTYSIEFPQPPLLHFLLAQTPSPLSVDVICTSPLSTYKRGQRFSHFVSTIPHENRHLHTDNVHMCLRIICKIAYFTITSGSMRRCRARCHGGTLSTFFHLHSGTLSTLSPSPQLC